MEIERTDWAAWSGDMDEKNFDMTVAAWGPSSPKDPKGLWGSAEAERKASINYVGFKNERVDELIEEYYSEFDADKRTVMLREIDAILVKEAPYILSWYNDNVRLLYWNKFGMPPTVLGKFSHDEAAALTYWWEDPDRREELEESKELDLALPEEPVELYFDKAFKPVSSSK
jgi:microcin C transport system substrate-binding protein